MKPYVVLCVVFGFVGLLGLGCMGGGGSISTNSGGGSGGNGQVQISIPGMSFSPQLASAHAGQTVKWTSSDASLPHTVTSDTGEAGLDSSTAFPSGLHNGDSFTWTVPANAQLGTHYFYHCAFHGSAGDGSQLGTGMAGEITVN